MSDPIGYVPIIWIGDVSRAIVDVYGKARNVPRGQESTREGWRKAIRRD